MVEESDEQYEKKNTRAKISVAEKRNAGMKITLNKKKEFENDKKGLNQIPKKKQMRATFLVTLFQVHYGTVSSIPQCKQLKYGVLQSK
jgi:hypothetical protein